jgi:hypothetical protein
MGESVMSDREITRSQFLRGGSCLAAGAVINSVVHANPCGAADCTDSVAGAARLRPYQLLCALCALGEDPPRPVEPKMAALLAAVRQRPDMPISLVCNAGDAYVYQDPGTADDTPEGDEFNRKRDLDILQRMSWPPGVTLPARTVFLAIVQQIRTVAGLCGYETVTGTGWAGCPKASSGCYERGCSKGLAAIIPPRDREELVREKQKSIEALHAAQEVTIRPHILLCAVCQYGGGLRPPYSDDNLPELLDVVLHKNPNLSIKFARGADWMMCAPCPNRSVALNACVNVLGSGGLSNEKRDLDMLQKLGLHFGSSLPARELYALIFERIPTTQDICRRDGNSCPCVWWDGCGESNVKEPNADYVKGRQELIEKFKTL